jgi:WD40 repeat protein
MNQVLGATFSADGKIVATTARDKKLRLFDALTGKLLQVGILLKHRMSMQPKSSP